MAADGGCEKDVVHRMIEVYSMGRAEKCPQQERIGDKGQELSI